MSDPIEQLVTSLSKLPGLGKRSARRAVLHLINNKDALLVPMQYALQNVADNIVTCSVCGNIDTHSPCHICTNEKRQNNILCVVEEVSDLWAIERSHMFKGKYHVLGGVLSALDGKGPEDLTIGALIERVRDGEVTEVILAMNATVDGQTTAHYISQRLGEFDVTVSKLAHGIPVGGELDYLDDGTLGAAFKARSTL